MKRGHSRRSQGVRVDIANQQDSVEAELGMTTVGIIVPVFGDHDVWKALADRAVESALAQTVAAEVVLSYGETLAEARNNGARQSSSDFLIHLDADDELDPYYIEAMLQGTGDLRQPSTLGVVNGVEDDYPVLIPPHSGGMLVGNHLIIGTMVRRSLFEAVGGFRDLPVLEDWDLWLRCIIAGAKLGTASKAIYKVHVRPDSRNTEANGHGRVYTEIQNTYRGQL